MRNEFCTPVNVDYLPRALALYRSLEEVCERFRLRIFCMDERTKILLDRLALPSAEVISLDELEAHDPALRAVKHTRSPVEYCWTAIPAITLCSLERDPELDLITYLDADIMFFHDPAPLFDELGDDSVVLIPHRFAPGFEQGVTGVYDSTFMPFRRDERGLAALRWWRERCLEWCYDRFEDGKWSDVNYLNDWPERFPGARVLEHVGGGLAPWNTDNYDVRAVGDDVYVDEVPLIFHHHLTLWLYRGTLTALPRRGFLSSYYRVATGPARLVWATPYAIGARERRLIWDPYLRRLTDAIADLRRVDPSFEAGFLPLSVRELAYSSARRVLPRAVRRAAKRLYRRRDVRRPPGSPQRP